MRKTVSTALALSTAALCAAPFPPARAEEGRVFVSDAGVPAEVEEMYGRALRALVASQKEDGSFEDPNSANPAVVSLAGLAMLAHGDDPNTGPYARPIARCLDFVLKHQNTEGYIGNSMYNQGFSTLFLAEAYGQVSDARIGPALQKAVVLLLRAQDGNPLGGWRYTPNASDVDASVMGACTVALVAAANAGVKLPENAYPKVQKCFRYLQDGSGRIGYSSPGGGSDALTAIGVLCLSLTKGKELPTYRRAAAALARIPVDRTESSCRMYGEYYRAQAEFRVGPESWLKFNAANIAARRQDQNEDGTWNGDQGPTFTTSAVLLSFALNYRYLPIYER